MLKLCCLRSRIWSCAASPLSAIGHRPNSVSLAGAVPNLEDNNGLWLNAVPNQIWPNDHEFATA